jgi:cell division protein FtsI (penicillin-binding protein 3)
VANSSNIGTVELTRQYLSKAELSSCLNRFGLGTPTSLGLPGETTGTVPGADMADYTRDQISFGQGLSVTAVQEAAAVAAIADGGVYHEPSLIKSVTDPDGTIDTPTYSSHRVVSQEASAQVMTMMESVISFREGRSIDNYRMAGKSGTAQAIDPATGLYSGYTASFVGVAPVEDPQLLVYVVVHNPTSSHQGSVVALPVVQTIMSQALAHYGVKPSTTKAPDTPLTYTP